MIRPNWHILNRRRFFPVAVLTAAALLAVWGGASLLSGLSISEKDLFNKAFANTMACPSYRYSVEVRQGARDTVTLVEGARAEFNRIHIRGSMQKSRMEFIQIDDTTYMKDPWSDRWFTLKGNALVQSELFIMEFNPMGLLKIKDTGEIKRLGGEKVNGKKTVVLEMRPVIANPFLEQRYTDFKYKVWVDPGENLIRRALVQARLPGGAEGMAVEVKFWDFNGKININPPENFFSPKHQLP